MAARGPTLAGTPNTQVPRAQSVQTQREVIVTIRDPSIIQSLWAMNPRNLKAHVERAIAQSGNENIISFKILSSNQLKSGDFSIKTATSNKVEALNSLQTTGSTVLATGPQYVSRRMESSHTVYAPALWTPLGSKRPETRFYRTMALQCQSGPSCV